MGGGKHFAYPKRVWSPAGGWWANPTHWKRNTFIYGCVVVLLTVPVWKLSNRLERSYAPKIVKSDDDEHDSHGHHH